ncbi:hypothetical protein ABZ215_25135 [Amycolatopsis sp. NPDC006131]|uniref:glycosyltransferase family 2 protein n=1 Tax=Amycolatopsis sp. NPDC006131 TaxID=3156731 RepID=UPI0033AA188E
MILVDTGAATPLPDTGTPHIRDDRQPRNISRWWNLGIRRANRLAQQDHDATEWNIVVLNDDCIVPAGWVSAMSTEMRASSATLAYPRMWHKITGYAFMLRGEHQLRADETLVWWYGDDDLEYQARAAGGVAVVATMVDHRHPDEQTYADPELMAQAERDAKTFQAKWGRMP